MRLAILTNQYPKISHTFVRREISALEEAGFEVLRYSIRPGPDVLIDPADLREKRLTRLVLDEGSGPALARATAKVAAESPAAFARAALMAAQMSKRSERGALVHGVYLAEACRLRLWLREEKVDHVHVHFGTNPATVALLCRMLGGPPYSFTAHGPEEFDKPDLLHLREKIENAAFVAAVSNFGRGQLMRHCGYEHWQKLQVVRCGVDGTFLRRAPRPLPAARRMLFIGRLAEQKGPMLLVEAAAMLRERGVRLELVMVGEGPLREEIEHLIEARGLQDTVKLAGWASEADIKEWINASRALVLPSLAEGLPVVIMEALAMGRPVLSTYVAGIPELVRPGDCGWLFPAGSSEDLAASMQEALEAPRERLQEMGLAGRARVAAEHNVTTNAAKLAELIRRSVRGSGQLEPTRQATPRSEGQPLPAPVPLRVVHSR